MKSLLPLILILLMLASFAGCAETPARETPAAPVWSEDTDIESFWQGYADSKGGLTWGMSTEYPEYDKVSEGDTLLILLPQGPCLMEFFHSRWRRANDVRRWHPSVNEFGGCPYVFD